MWFIYHLYNNHHLRQFSKFSIIGFFNTFLDYSVYVLFTRVFGLYFIAANIIAISVAMIYSFIFNKYWTFRNYDRQLRSQSIKFFMVNIVYFLLNNSIVYLLVEIFEVYDLLAKVGAIIISLFWNFFANKLWVFKPLKKQ